MRRFPPLFLVGLALMLITLGAYRHVGQCGFVNLDDDAYVEFAPLVNQGVRSAALVWAFTAIHTANWHPLTTLSHMIDCTVFGVHPGPMHWENVAWHLLNSTLVLLVWHRLSGALWRSAFVAALFALHPLHVESVAWISSRKDLLSTAFWLLGIAAYLHWQTKRSRGRYALVIGCLLAALLAKPMAVTFPATLLLLDAWPLRRWSGPTWRQLFTEKIPLFAVVAAHSVTTFVVQHHAGAAQYAERIPLGARLGNAVVAYGRYLGKTLWPESLSPLYWHPGYWPAAWVLGGLLLLGGISALVWRQRLSRPWLLFGWLWFLGTLVPAIGIVQVGAQAMADRYTYVSLLGIFTIIAWGGAEVVATFPRARAPLAGAVLTACVLVTQRQVQAWQNSEALYAHGIAVGEDNPAIRYLLARAQEAAGRPEAAVAANYERAIQLEPNYVNAHTQLALLDLRHQRLDAAQHRIERNIQFEPKNASLHRNLGAFWVIRGDLTRAEKHLADALALGPDAPGIHREIALLRLRQNRVEEARQHFETAVRADPWNVSDLTQLGFLVGNEGRLPEAKRYFSRALWIDPTNEMARRNLAVIAQSEPGRKN